MMEAMMTERDPNSQNLPTTTQQAQAEGHYAVGYKRPPAHTRFKPGQSGNPKGRPKPPRNLWDEAKEVFTGKVVMREGDKKTHITRINALVRKLVDMGLQGDTRAGLTALKFAKDLGVMAEFATDKKNSGPYTREELRSLSDATLDELIALERKRESQMN